MHYAPSSIAPAASLAELEAQLGRLSDEALIQFINEVAHQDSEFVIRILEKLSHHKHPPIRGAVASALVSFDYLSIVSILLRLLTDRFDDVRVQATLTLGQFGLRETLPLLRRMTSDKSAEVRRATLIALSSLSTRAPSDVLSVSTKLILDQSPLNAMAALQVIKGLRATSVEDHANAVMQSVERFHPVLYKMAGISDAPVALRPPKFLTPVLNRRGRTLQTEMAGEVNISPLLTALKRVDDAIKPKASRHLNAWWSGMHANDEFVAGDPPFLSSRDGYKYKLSCAISSDDLAGDFLIHEPFAPADADMVLAVALVADDEYLKVEGEAAKGLSVPSEGDSNIIDFEVRGLKPGNTALEMLVYRNGSLILRAVTSEIVVKHRDGIVVHKSGSSITATVMSKTAEHLTRGGAFLQKRLASLLISPPLSSSGNKLVFALFIEDGNQYVFKAVRIPSGRVQPNRVFLRNGLAEFLNLRKGLGGAYKKVFVNDSFDFRVKPKHVRKGLQILKAVGMRLWSDVFEGFDGLKPIRERLQGLIKPTADPSVLQIVSDTIFLPWQLMYLNDGKKEANPNQFLGMCLQVEQMLATGLDLRVSAVERPDKSIAAYVNSGLPEATLKLHRQVLKTLHDRETELLADLKRPNNRSPAIYLYCHAEYDQHDYQQSWIELTNVSGRVTLGTLRDTTRVDPATQQQIEFKSAPLVFLNACHSGQMDSALYQSFVGFMLRDKKAGGVLGTETRMPAFFATAFAVEFWRRAHVENVTIAKLLFDLRQYFWKQYNNPLGFLYSLYVNGDLTITLS